MAGKWMGYAAIKHLTVYESAFDCKWEERYRKTVLLECENTSNDSRPIDTVCKITKNLVAGGGGGDSEYFDI